MSTPRLFFRLLPSAFVPLFVPLALLAGAACTSTSDLGSNQSSSAPTSDAGDAGPDPTRMRIFGTKAAYKGDLLSAGHQLTGLDGADALCQAAADGAQLGGNFVAFLSDARTDARDRLSDDGPWYLVDRTTPVFTNKNAMSAAPTNPVDKDESGGKPSDEISGVDQFGNVWAEASSALYWTGGVGMHTATCESWTSSNGVPTEGAVAPGDFSDYPSAFCEDAHRLVCVEQKAKPTPRAKKHVFLTAQSFTGDFSAQTGTADGLLGGDKLCATAAKTAGRAGTWKAWLSGQDAKGARVRAADRLTGDSQYLLLDDVTLVFARHADLLGTPLNAIDQDETGQNYTNGGTVWTGTNDASVVSADTCSGWTVGSRDSSGSTGTVGDPAGWTSGGGSFSCINLAHLYCFEQ